MVRLLIISIAFFFSFQAMAADCGVFKVVKGDVTYSKKGNSKFRKARKNKKVCQGYTVKTAVDSRAKIQMADKNEINISPDSELIIEAYETGKKAVLNVINGKVRSDVKQKYNDTKQSHYRVKTKSAVAGVRGTEFLTSYSRATNRSRVVTFEGEVAVGQIKGGNFIPQVTVKPGQYTSNSVGTAPHPARDVPPAEFAQMDQESKVDDASPSKQPASATQPEKKPSDDKGSKPEPKLEPKSGKGQKGPQGARGNPKPGIAVNGDGSDGIVGNGNPGEVSDDQSYRDDEQYGDPNFDPSLEDGSGGERDIASIEPDGGMNNLLPPPDLEAGPAMEDMIGIEPNIGIVDMDNFAPVDSPMDNPIIQDGVINTSDRVQVIINPCLPGQCGN